MYPTYLLMEQNTGPPVGKLKIGDSSQLISYEELSRTRIKPTVQQNINTAKLTKNGNAGYSCLLL